MSKPPLEIQLQTLPHQPGVYQYFDADDKILYVGKAKDLKKRVSSYFTKNHDYGKTKVLVKKIVTIKHIVVETETDALLLENNLIKKYQPRYNVLLKDDKSYPWICIKNERFPRVFSTRRVFKDGSEYFGPYTSMKTVHTLLDLIKGLYQLRTCNYDLSKDKVEAGKYKVCLEYHLGNCKGPCEDLQTETDYHQNIIAIKEILKGNFKESLSQFKQQMKTHAKAMEFEDAQRIKEKIDILENYQSKSTVVNPKISNVDVFSIVSDESYGYVNFLQLSYGSIIRSHTLEIKKKLDETDEALLQLAITEIRQRFHSKSKEIYVPFIVDLGEDIKLTIPKLGDKKRVLELSERNAKYYRMERFKQVKITDPDRHVNRIMAQMKTDLQLKTEPRHIECFDNSNIQGTNPVAACVVFKNGKPSKKDYRHFNIKTVEGPDDFASMEEVVYRRYKRLLDENQPLPQLIIIDGGKGHLNTASNVLNSLDLEEKIELVSIAKGEKRNEGNETFYFKRNKKIKFKTNDKTLFFLQRLRDEAHRFAINAHRVKRKKDIQKSLLDQINGIGSIRKRALLNHFGSARAVESASFDEIKSVEGVEEKVAKKIYNFFHE